MALDELREVLVLGLDSADKICSLQYPPEGVAGTGVSSRRSNVVIR
jgi:hypothetical protein